MRNQLGYGFVDTALQVHGVHASGDIFHAFAHDGLRQHGSGGGAVTSVVRGFGSDFLDHLRAHVLQFVFEFDFFGNGNTVFGDQRRTERTLQDHIAAFWTQGGFHGVSQNIYAFNHAGAGVCAKYDFFSSHCYSFYIKNKY